MDNIYKFNEISTNKYSFITEKGSKYVLNLIKQNNILIFNYSVNGDFDKIINEGNMYKVLRTIFTILKKYVDKNNWVKYIGYVPVRRSTENIDNNIRHKLYLRFFKKYFNINHKDVKIKKAPLKGENYVFINIKNEMNEVRYLDTKAYNIPKEKPLKDSENIRVYHGFYSYEIAIDVLKKGLSGKERARRIYSFESGNNPYGLFVTVDFQNASKFASSGVIIEFTTKVSDLEAPVWVGGRSYFVQGEYTQSFKDLDEREQQRLLNRQKAGESPYDSVSKSDRPELGETLFDNPERQALYIGDLNPNMIKRVWYNEIRHKERLTNRPWEKFSVNSFLKHVNEIGKNKKRKINFYPNDDFTVENFKSFLDDEDELQHYIDHIIRYDIDNDYRLREYGFWPKQIKQMRELHSKGYLDKYLKENRLINIINEEYGNLIGKGISGSAYKMDDGKVYKETDSIFEYLMAKKLKNYDKELKSLPKIYDLGKNEKGKYFIIKDYFNKINKELYNKLSDEKMKNLIENYMKTGSDADNISINLGRNFLQFLNNLKSELHIIGVDYKDFDVDYIEDNIGLDNNGNIILFDF